MLVPKQRPINPLPSVAERTVHSSAFKALFQGAQALDGNVAVLIAEIGLTPADLDDAERRYPVADLYVLYELLAQRTATPDIGVYIGRIDYIRHLNLQLYACSGCSTFREYLNIMPSVLSIVGDIGEFKVRRDGELIRLDWEVLTPPNNNQRYVSDASLTVAAAIVNSACVRQIPIRAAHFHYAQPDDLSVLKQAFGDNLHFSKAKSCLYLDAASLDYVLIRPDSEWALALAQPIRHLFEDGEDNDFIVALRKTLLKLLPSGDIGLDRAASSLNISRRTLQRRLADAGTQYLQLLQNLRSTLAVQYLHDERLSITEIAFLLGYMDQSSFSAAFRSWHGQSPRDFRKK
ncbi:MAG: AraC family transcriptional regulator ligand-binding domain-containing protein [Zhongshania sp.]|nr:AraC family transcriptional regulator ligand-binding domain-containing protein [Zhongshania sp.]